MRLNICLAAAGMAAALLAGCSGQGVQLAPDAVFKKTDETRFVIPPIAWNPGAPMPGVTFEITAPKSIPADAALMQIRLVLANTEAAPAALTAPTPCSVSDWRILDAKGSEVMRKRPALCEQSLQTRELSQGDAIEQIADVPLEPNVLKRGQPYRLEYRFWNIPGGVNFAAE
ncbi:MAG TPA: hypothetical protein VEU47_05665 [Candidatus Cybelea sp.]|nr:hypothetical protein [Candidatus Cybelea sp.]